MVTKTLIEFASDKTLTQLLVKERVKCCRRNRSDKHHYLDKACKLDDLSTRKMLSRLMPPRRTWVRQSKKVTLPNGAKDTRKSTEKTLMQTIKRDTKLWHNGQTFGYLEEQQAFFDRIRKRLSDKKMKLDSPTLFPIFKDKEKRADGTWNVTCRPLSVYSKLEDKIILALTSRYLTRYFDRYLHENILSYRPARDFNNKKHHVTDFNEGMELIKAFREKHNSEPIYAADCDIKKFYDITSHKVVRECFQHMLDNSPLDQDGKEQVMRVLEAYLASYNFYTNALMKSQEHVEVFTKVRHRLHDSKGANTYQLGKVDISDEEYQQRGVPQGGALSLLVANIVLNDVDKVIVDQPDDNRLFIRYCDDMILLHTDYDECCRLMNLYTQSLDNHKLYYHNLEPVSNSKSCHRAVATTSSFWKIKSHLPFLWGEGDGNSNYYIGFLGYEIRRDGRIRLRKSNIKRFDEKFERQRFALHRYRKKKPEDYLELKKQVLDRFVKGVEFYSALDMQQFKRTAQYRYLEKLQARLDKR